MWSVVKVCQSRALQNIIKYNFPSPELCQQQNLQRFPSNAHLSRSYFPKISSSLQMSDPCSVGNNFTASVFFFSTLSNVHLTSPSQISTPSPYESKGKWEMKIFRSRKIISYSKKKKEEI